MKQAKPSLAELEAYFETRKIPPDTVKIDSATTVINPSKFVKSHLSILKNNPGNKRYKPYYDRLVVLYLIDKEKQ